LHLYSQLLKLLLVITLLTLFSGCGYKPSAKYAREILGKRISTTVIISAEDPENSVVVKDAVDGAIVEIFHAALVNRRISDTHLDLKLSEPIYTPVQYNNNGFVIAYRATITLAILRESKDIKKNYKATGTYDFSVVPNAVLTDQERFDAIKYSSIKAIASFVAQVSAEGSRSH